MTTQYVYTFRGHVYSTRQQALEDFASAVFDFCVTDNTEDMSHEEKIFYALCVIENKTETQWKHLYELGLEISKNSCHGDFEIEERKLDDSFYDNEAGWCDPDGDIPKMLAYYYETYPTR
jgi:hypothetical protein